jgi:hypothetical protein
VSPSPSRDVFHLTNSQAAEVLGLLKKYFLPSRKIRISTNIDGKNITSYKEMIFL